MSAHVSLHDVVAIRIAPKDNNGTRWVEIHVTHRSGPSSEVIIFHSDPRLAVEVDSAMSEVMA